VLRRPDRTISLVFEEFDEDEPVHQVHREQPCLVTARIRWRLDAVTDQRPRTAFVLALSDAEHVLDIVVVELVRDRFLLLLDDRLCVVDDRGSCRTRRSG